MREIADKNLFCLYQDTSFFLSRSHTYRKKTHKIFGQYLYKNRILIQAALDKFSNLDDSTFSSLKNSYKMGISSSIYSKGSLLGLMSYIRINDLTETHEYSVIEEPLRRLAYLMWSVDTSTFELIDYPLIKLLPKVIIKSFSSRYAKKDKERFYIRISGGTTDENREEYLNLNFLGIPNTLEIEQHQVLPDPNIDYTFGGIYNPPNKPFLISLEYVGKLNLVKKRSSAYL